MRTGRLRTGWDGHLLLAYGSPTERLTGLVAWAQDGLDQGERLLCVEAPGGPGTMVSLFERAGVPAVTAQAAGALQMISPRSHGDCWSPEDVHDHLEAALSAGFTGLRLSLRSPLAGCGGADAEAAIDELVGGGPVAVLCQHDRGTGLEPLAAAVGAHPDGFRTAMLTMRRVGEGLALAGEIDISNVGLFASALSTALRGTGRFLWLDLADLRFMDVAGCRCLARTTRTFRNEGGSLLLVDPLPPVAHVLGLLGVDRLRGVEIIGR